MTSNALPLRNIAILLTIAALLSITAGCCRLSNQCCSKSHCPAATAADPNTATQADCPRWCPLSLVCPKKKSCTATAAAPEPLSVTITADQAANPADPVTAPRSHWPTRRACYQPVGVGHTAGYMHDTITPSLDRNDTFDSFTLTNTAAVVVAPAVFAAEVVTLPVAAIVSPPWTTVYSRGAFAVVEPTDRIAY